MSDHLPGDPGPTLCGIWEELAPDVRTVFRDCLIGAMSAERLAAVLDRHGHSVSASTIRTYRRSLRQIGDALER